MRVRLTADEGFAVVTAIVLMSVMIALGLATFAMVDTGSSRSRESRERDSSFALAEGVLQAQGTILARNWPTPSGTAYPSSCSSTMATTQRCPNRDTLDAANSATPGVAAFTGPDYGGTNTSWTTRVRDNYGALAESFDSAQAGTALTGSLGTCAAPCSRDFNDDKVLWVQSLGVVRGRPRNIVAKLKLEQVGENVPQTAVVAGALKNTNNGTRNGRYIIDATDSEIVVRCTPDPPNGGCTNYRSGQISPVPLGGNPPPLMTPEQILRFRDRAIADGTHHEGCPPQTGLVGAVVFVENCQDPPSYKGEGSVACDSPPYMDRTCINTIQSPGFLIVRCGALRTTGGWTFVGVVYFVNGSDGSCTPRGTTPPTCSSNQLDANSVIDMQGGGGIWGALVVDGNACVLIGSNGTQIKYTKNAFGAAKSYGAVGLVQNTWRELKPVPAL